jgi:DNA repair protein RadC
VQITRLLRDASKTVEIEMLDHIIIGNRDDDPLARGYYSFREAGLI